MRFHDRLVVVLVVGGLEHGRWCARYVPVVVLEAGGPERGR